MEDVKIIVALIAAGVSLALGIANILVTLFKIKKENKILLKQEELRKTIEEIKTENQKQILEYQQRLMKIELTEKNKINKEKSILKNIQYVKDSIYLFENRLKAKGLVVTNNNIEILFKSIFDYIDVYNSNYSSMGEYERARVHDFKNILHKLIVEVEAYQRSEKIDDIPKSELIESLDNCVNMIDQTQQDLRKHYAEL